MRAIPYMYPQDVSPFNETKVNVKKLLDSLHNPADGKKPIKYCKIYLQYARCRRHSSKTTRKATGKQLTYLRRDLDAVDGKLLQSTTAFASPSGV